MPRTSGDLVRRAAGRLGVLASGQSLETEDEALLQAEVDGLLLKLASRGVFDLADKDQIPDDALVPLATCLAAEVAADFGVDVVKFEQLKVLAERELRQIKAKSALDVPQTAEYM